ncbi:MAG: YjcZ family sporulation protein [Bacilli bacterium]
MCANNCQPTGNPCCESYCGTPSRYGNGAAIILVLFILLIIIIGVNHCGFGF